MPPNERPLHCKLGIWLLHSADARTFREVFGLTVAIYAGYMLFRPSLTYLREMNQSRNALIGFGGGLISGLTVMPGALPTIWCDMHGVPKSQQRGLVQPFIAAMQIFALAMMLARPDLSSKVLVDLALSIPRCSPDRRWVSSFFAAPMKRCSGILTVLFFSDALLVM